MDKKILREEIADIDSSIKYFTWIIETHARSVHEARKQIAQAQLRLANIHKERELAPGKLEKLQQRRKEVMKNVQIEVHKPKLDQIARLREKIAFLEKKHETKR